MQTLEHTFPYLVGYSDNGEGILVPIMARTMGACVIEKHFTLDKNLPSPDHKASLDPKELREVVKAVRDVEKALGSPIKKQSEAEKRIAKVARKSIVANVAIPKGSIVNRQMLIVKRPGTGLLPKYLSTLIGKKMKHDISKDQLLSLRDLL